MVALEQADGDYDLERDNNNGDSGDPWPGATWNTLFARDTEPDSRDYNGEDTEVTVYDIDSIDSTVINFDIGVFAGVGPEGVNLFLLERIPEEHRYPNPDDDEVTISEVDLVTSILEDIWIEPGGHGSELPDDLDEFNAIFYLESWRDGAEAGDGLTRDEQVQLVEFLEDGGRLLLVGPDLATNLRADDSPLLPYLMADYSGEGNPADEGNIRIVQAVEGTRISGMRFPFRQHGPCDHYVDVVGPGEGAYGLFQDQDGEPRGVIAFGESGYRVILQPFLFGGLIDWGGTKSRLIRLYLQQLRFYLSASKEELMSGLPTTSSLIKAWPNPFNGALNVSFKGASSGARLTVLDIAGRRIGSLEMNSATGVAMWRPRGLPSGGYWIALRGSRGSKTVRVVYLK